MRLSMRMGSLEVVGIQRRGCVVATHGEGMDMIQYQRGIRNVRVFWGYSYDDLRFFS